jgi:hypothetical protein
MDVCAELTDEDQMRAWTLRCNTAGFPKRPQYIVDFWYQRVKEALGRAEPCRCGGIWVCGLHQPRRRGETTHILDWYCARCHAPAGHDGLRMYTHRGACYVNEQNRSEQA